MKYFVSLSFFMLGFMASQAQTTANQPVTKLAYADIEYIFSQLPDAKEIQTELTALEAQLTKQIELKDQELKNKYAELLKNSEGMLDAVRDNVLQEIQDGQDNLERFKQEAGNNVQRRQAQLVQPVLQKMRAAIAVVAKANGYTMILSPRANNSDMILYAREDADVSDLVLKQLGVTPKPQPSK